MKDLLDAIKTELQSELYDVRNSDIFVTEDELLIPDVVRFPAVALKDGPVTWSIMSQGPSKQQTLTVHVIAYVQILKPEASVIGDGTHKGVLEIIDQIRTALDENTLDDEVSNAEVVSETASEVFGDEEIMIQRKSITFRYERWNI